MAPPDRFQPLKPWLIERYGRPVFRVALDAGSTCPNRDGTRGHGGCTYCDVEGSGTGALRTGLDLVEQFETGWKRVRRREPDVRVIAYLQSYSNTYVEDGRFDEVLTSLEPYLGDPIVCVSVATRPDTLPDASLRRLERLRAKGVDVWVELGLEAADDRVLLDINRLHSVEEFEDAVARAHSAGVLVVGHAILGLPGDGREGARRTAAVLGRSRCEGVKVHQTMVLERTQLAAQWRRGDVQTLAVEDYVAWCADFLERLHPAQVVHRLQGDSPAEKLLAPLWPVAKNRVRELVNLELARRDTRQGSRFETLKARPSC
ncbi:MAG: TIGR01212 family radical SAM protein [Planctomycetota bacterium]